MASSYHGARGFDEKSASTQNQFYNDIAGEGGSLEQHQLDGRDSYSSLSQHQNDEENTRNQSEAPAMQIQDQMSESQ